MKLLPAETPFDGVPYVGCAATIHVGSDSYPGTVVWVSEQTASYKMMSGKEVQVPRRLRIARCQYRGVPGHSNAYTEDQRYEYYEDNSPEYGSGEWSWREKRKNYIRVGTSARSSAAQAPGFGYRRAYRDPCF